MVIDEKRFGHFDGWVMYFGGVFCFLSMIEDGCCHNLTFYSQLFRIYLWIKILADKVLWYDKKLVMVFDEKVGTVWSIILNDVIYGAGFLRMVAAQDDFKFFNYVTNLKDCKGLKCRNGSTIVKFTVLDGYLCFDNAEGFTGFRGYKGSAWICEVCDLVEIGWRGFSVVQKQGFF